MLHAKTVPTWRIQNGRRGGSHWRNSSSDDVAYAIAGRSTRSCSGVHHEGTARDRCSRYGVDPVHTARGVVETLREQLRWKRGEPLLRWLVEVETAITARRIVDPLSKVAFGMTCHCGRARFLAYGRRLTDPTCFYTYELFEEELRQAFEPPQNEFRLRA
ncbi:unnamed protein product [Phytophthora fragariaefolia]|uniref:Unnamed protein product n=1 Tax=Phytophthora fragariaefolia TaxID=1490495 RepID=A0A9W7CWL4_9STRA|nr:unnamed protein product [Phytophthora fragariaefolia]